MLKIGVSCEICAWWIGAWSPVSPGNQVAIQQWTGEKTFKQTSYNNNFRKQYAGIGDTYDATKDVFIKPKPHASWTLDSGNDWQAPLARPNDCIVKDPENGTKSYTWDESAYQEDNSTGWTLAE